jgi:Ca2+-binding RTX toxin-like protein
MPRRPIDDDRMKATMKEQINFDRLESRHMLTTGGAIAYVRNISGTVAVIMGTDQSDLVYVGRQQDGTAFIVLNDRNTVLDPGTRYLYITGGDGDDLIINDTALEAVVHGGRGNDFIVGGAAPEVLWGDEGSDLIVGDPTRDFIVPEPEYPGEFVLDMLGGVAILYGTPADDAVTITDREPKVVEVLTSDGGSLLLPTYLDLVLDLGAGTNLVEVNTNAVRVLVADVIRYG